MSDIFIEAESFKDLGGWVIDSTASEFMGSPYIMAHGLGCPVKDAMTDFDVDEDGEYSVYCRTRDWTAVWKRGTPAGLFKIIIDNNDFGCKLGNNGEKWSWQLAGKVKLNKGKHYINLVDLTGFNGRCDAIYMSTTNTPANDEQGLKELRRAFLPEPIVDTNQYDLVVVGGGIAGICTALTAYRKKLKVILIEEQNVLGGCNSSNVRVCCGGSIFLPPYPSLGRIVKEITPVMGSPLLYDAKYYEDDRKLNAFEVMEDGCFSLVRNVLLSTKVDDVTMKNGEIVSVTAYNIITGQRTVISGKNFCDCSGDAVLSRLCGASYMYGRDARATFNESSAPLTNEKLVMGHSIRWCTEKCQDKQSFPDIDFAIPMTDETCLHVLNGDWEQETGFRRDMVSETEYIRDYGLLSIFSNWSFQKNHSSKKEEYENYRLKWVSHIGGKRESCRVVGDYILTQNDIENNVYHEDGTASLSWSIDMHFPEMENEETFGEAFRSFAYHRGFANPYPVPYRCLYSKEINNLFLGGRIISLSHIAFSSARVMRTLGSLGEVVGLAAYVCQKHNCKPRDVYTKFLDEFKEELTKGVPSPDVFHGGLNPNESYHFKDAGWVDTPITKESLDKSKYKDKIIKNIKRLQIKNKFKGYLD